MSAVEQHQTKERYYLTEVEENFKRAITAQSGVLEVFGIVFRG
jgi:hypothetical protein